MESMEHLFWNVKPYKKTEIAVKSVRRAGRSIIFCRTRAGVDRLSEEMKLDSVPSLLYMEDSNQKQRDRAMRNLAVAEVWFSLRQTSQDGELMLKELIV